MCLAWVSSQHGNHRGLGPLTRQFREQKQVLHETKAEAATILVRQTYNAVEWFRYKSHVGVYTKV